MVSGADTAAATLDLVACTPHIAKYKECKLEGGPGMARLWKDHGKSMSTNIIKIIQFKIIRYDMRYSPDLLVYMNLLLPYLLAIYFDLSIIWFIHKILFAGFDFISKLKRFKCLKLWKDMHNVVSWWSRRSYHQTSTWERSEGGWEKRTTLHMWLCYAIRSWAEELKARQKLFCDSRLDDCDSKGPKYHKNEWHERIAVHHLYHLLLLQSSAAQVITSLQERPWLLGRLRDSLKLTWIGGVQKQRRNSD